MLPSFFSILQNVEIIHLTILYIRKMTHKRKWGITAEKSQVLIFKAFRNFDAVPRHSLSVGVECVQNEMGRKRNEGGSG